MNACQTLQYAPSEVLTASPLPQLRGLVVTVNESEVVITGRVSSYYMKQLAQEALAPPSATAASSTASRSARTDGT